MNPNPKHEQNAATPAKDKGKNIRGRLERKNLMELVIAGVSTLAVICWIATGAAAFKHRESGVIWTTYFAIVFTLLAFFLTWQKRVLERKEHAVENNRPDTALEKSLQLSGRAYIAINDIQVDWQTGVLAVILENTGKIPAQDPKVYLLVGRTPYNEKGEPIFEGGVGQRVSTDWGHTPIFPGIFKTPIVVRLKDFDPKSDPTAILSGRTELHIGGNIQYGDGFGNPARLDFGFRYEPPPANKWTNLPVRSFAELQALEPEMRRKEEEQKREAEKANKKKPN